MSQISPYIKIAIVSTCEKKLSEKDILEIIRDRFIRTHNVDVSWKGTEEKPRILIQYPSEEYFKQCYAMGLEFFVKIVESFKERNLDLVNIFPSGNSADSGEDCETLEENYMILRYETNFMEPMQKNYEFTAKAGALLGSQFFVEAIDGGFLMFYKRKDDFLGAQMDRSNPAEIRRWMEERSVDFNHPVIKEFLQIVQDLGK